MEHCDSAVAPVLAFVISVQIWELCSPAAFAGLQVQGSDVHRVVCNNSRKRKLPIHEDGWELSDFFSRKKKKQKNVGSHLLRDEIRKKQMGIEMVPESAS